MKTIAGLAGAAILTVTLLGACVTATLAPGAAEITVTERPQDVQHCTAAGYVQAEPPDTNDLFTLMASTDPANVLRNEALALGADTLFRTDSNHGVAYHCGTSAAKGAAAPMLPVRPDVTDSPVPVVAATAVKGDMPIRLQALGTITPLATVTVKAQVSGQLMKIVVTEGQLVQAGDLLAEVDARTYQAALALAQANLKRDQALLAGLKQEQEQRASRQQYSQKLAVAQAVVDADLAALGAAQLNLDRTRVVAPVVGRVGLRHVDPGNYVGPTDANGILVITSLQPISAVFTLPEDHLSQISSRLSAGATLPVTVWDRENAHKLAEGKLLAIDNQIDTTAGVVKLRALFDNKDGVLFPNQFINVQLLVDTLHDQVLIPSAAVHRGTPNGVNGDFVYLVDTKKHTVSVRAVTLGPASGETCAVTSGVSSGDVVVTEGGDRLRGGARVVLRGPKISRAAEPDRSRLAPRDGEPPGWLGAGPPAAWSHPSGSGTRATRRTLSSRSLGGRQSRDREGA